MNRKLILTAVIAVMVTGLANLHQSPPPSAAVPSPGPAGPVLPSAGAGSAAALAALDITGDQPATADPAQTGPANPMAEQLAEIARTYRDNSRFPPYSKPLTSNDWSALNPRAFSATELPLENAPSLRVSIELPAFIIDRNQDLPIRVIVASEAGATVRASAGQILLRQGQTMTEPVLLASQGAQGNVEVFAVTVPATTLSQLAEGETEVAARLTLSDGQPASVVSLMRLYQSTASLTGLGASYVDGADLVIPTYFTVVDPGLYRLQGNLFSAGGEPVSHLNNTLSLTAGNSTGLLRVHSSVLREVQQAGPYLLTDINLMRMPAAPGDPTRYGSSVAEQYQVGGFALDAYSDEPFQDPAAQQRLEFLERLSSSAELP